MVDGRLDDDRVDDARLVVGVGSVELGVGGAVRVVGVIVVVAVVALVVGAVARLVVSGVRESRVPAIEDLAAPEDTGSRPGTVTGGRIGVAVAVTVSEVDAATGPEEPTGVAIWPAALPQAARSTTAMP